MATVFDDNFEGAASTPVAGRTVDGWTWANLLAAPYRLILDGAGHATGDAAAAGDGGVAFLPVPTPSEAHVEIEFTLGMASGSFNGLVVQLYADPTTDNVTVGDCHVEFNSSGTVMGYIYPASSTLSTSLPGPVTNGTKIRIVLTTAAPYAEVFMDDVSIGTIDEGIGANLEGTLRFGTTALTDRVDRLRVGFGPLDGGGSPDPEPFWTSFRDAREI